MLARLLESIFELFVSSNCHSQCSFVTYCAVSCLELDIEVDDGEEIKIY